MYFFWITISQICAGYIAKEDNSFNAMIPVTKKDIVKSKIYSIMFIELLHILFGIIFGIIHNLLYGINNFLLDINIAFFGIVIVMFALFNIVFLPRYFKTAYYYGKQVIVGVVITLIYVFIFEYGVLRFKFMANIFEGDIQIQMIVLIVGVVISLILSYVTVKASIKNYESIK
jgi:hypothetical protein